MDCSKNSEKVRDVIDFIGVIQQTRSQFGTLECPVVIESESSHDKAICFIAVVWLLERMHSVLFDL